ncbi:hypothetical protein QQS21_010197 [Conoideocrella luteorostrata]|uniref:Beta-lactamase-related domain-containing protein n=1 Tax=Conoideocrella luteorostrata TaxID=1105319 RepID=A0AAJ0FPL5_9HYPO|nr:hypothetical protein QQS21_010197 [Conoideocrella luteorostrata]
MASEKKVTWGELLRSFWPGAATAAAAAAPEAGQNDATESKPIYTAEQNIRTRVQSRVKDMDEIRSLCRVSSISVGILHEGKPNFEQNIVRRDDPSASCPDSQYLYTLCSVSKTFVSAALGILVEDGCLCWTDTVGQYLPNFNPVGDVDISEKATFNDILRHSGGLDNPVVSLLGPGGKVMVPQHDFMDVLNGTPTTRHGKTLFGSWTYSNVGYALLALVVEEVSGEPFAQFVQSRILTPLGMNNTVVTAARIKESGAVAHSYAQDAGWVMEEPSTLADNTTKKDEQAARDKSILGQKSGKRILYKSVGIGFCGTCSVNMFPETRSAVVAFSNGTNCGDAADFCASLLMQELFDLELRVDILDMAWGLSEAEGDALNYKGAYRGLGITLTIQDGANGDGLDLYFNGRMDMTQPLKHFAKDQYSFWPESQDAWLEGGWLDWDYYLVGILTFVRNGTKANEVIGLTWVWEEGCDPYLFQKVDCVVAPENDEAS